MALSLLTELDAVFGPGALADALFYGHSPVPCWTLLLPEPGK